MSVNAKTRDGDGARGTPRSFTDLLIAVMLAELYDADMARCQTPTRSGAGDTRVSRALQVSDTTHE